jgi:hypothetical protein
LFAADGRALHRALRDAERVSEILSRSAQAAVGVHVLGQPKQHPRLGCREQRRADERPAPGAAVD